MSGSALRAPRSTSQQLLLLLFTHAPSPKHLQIFLRKNKALISKPATNSTKNGSDRSQIQSREFEIEGKRWRPTEDVAKRAIALSDTLNINEKEAFILFVKAQEVHLQRQEQTVEEIAQGLYYQERLDRLESLELLLQVRAAGGYSQYGAVGRETFAVIDTFIRDTSLGDAVAYAAKNISENLNTQNNPRREFVESERQSFARILFLRCLIDASELGEKEVTTLLNLLRDVSDAYATAFPDSTFPAPQFSMVMPAGPTASFGRLVPGASHPAASLAHDVHLLLSSVLCVLFEPLEDGHFMDSINSNNNSSRESPVARMIRSSQWLRSWQATLRSPWKHGPILALVRFAWRVSLERMGEEGIRAISSSPDAAENDDIAGFVERGCLDIIGAMFSNSVFRRLSSLVQDTVVSLFDAMICTFLSRMPERVRELRSSQEEAVRAHQTFEQFRIGPRPEASRMHFDRLLVALAVLYDGRAALTRKFWDQVAYPDLHQFIRITGEGILSGSFVPYMAFVTALASGPECATSAFTFLESPSRRFINWFHFFGALDNYQKEYQETEATSPAGGGPVVMVGSERASALAIRPEELNGLHAILRLLARVAQDSPVARLRLVEDPRWAVLETLFRVLVCPVPPNLKADLLIAIRMLAIETSVTTKVWQFLEAVQLLSVQGPNVYLPSGASGGSSAAGGGGIRFELAEIESRRTEYPYVTAFVELVRQLIRHDAVSLASGISPPLTEASLSAYTQFIQKDVFERGDERTYKNASEEWRVARPALQYLLSLAVLAAKALPASTHAIMSAVHATSEPVVIAGGRGNVDKGDAGRGSGNGAEAQAHQGPIALSAYESVGIDLLFQLLQQSPLLNRVLKIISFGQERLGLARQQDGGEDHEECVLICLQLLLLVLKFQESIIRVHAELGDNVAFGSSATANNVNQDGNLGGNNSTQGIPPTMFSGVGFHNMNRPARHVVPLPLHELLISNRLDIISIAEYVHYTQSPRITTLSVEILRHLSNQEGMGSLIVRSLAERGKQVPFVQAYVELLETPESDALEETDESHSLEEDVMSGADLSMDDPYSGPVATQMTGAATDALYNAQLDGFLGVHSSVRMTIVQLIADAASLPAPNLAQFLLGVPPAVAEASIGITSLGSATGSRLRGAGGLALPYTALDALVNILQDPQLLETRPGLAWMCYKLIYTLIKEPSTRLRTTTLLRGLETDFFCQQLVRIPLTTQYADLADTQLDAIDSSTHKRIKLHHIMLARGWLFKAIALELHLTRSSGHRSYASRLLDLLFSIQQADTATNSASESAIGASMSVPSASASSHWGAGPGASATGDLEMDTNAMDDGLPQQQQRMKMRELLDALEVRLSQPTPSFALVSHIFGRLDLNLVSLTARDSGLPIVHVQLLHELLQQQQLVLEADISMAVDRHQIQQEVRRILGVAVSWNSFTQLLAAHSHAFDGWKQILLATLTECYHFLGGNTQETILYELLDVLLTYLTDGYPPTTLSSHSSGSEALALGLGIPIAECVLLLMGKLGAQVRVTAATTSASLRDIASDAGTSSGGVGSVSRNYSSVFARRGGGESSLTGGDSTDGSISTQVYLPLDQLLSILSGVVKAILKAFDVHMRISLYSALLNFLQMIHIRARSNNGADRWSSARSTAPGSPAASSTSGGSIEGGVSEHILLQHEQLHAGARKILNGAGFALVETVARDANIADRQQRAVAFAVLDQLFANYDPAAQWARYVAQHGLFRHFFGEILEADRSRSLLQLMNPANNSADTGAELFLYDNMMSMFLSLANAGPTHASLLVEHGMISTFTEVQYIDCRPHEVAMYSGDVYGMTELAFRYRLLVAPVFHLVHLLLVQTNKNESIIDQVMGFVAQHVELLLGVMRDAVSPLTAESLQLVAPITAILFLLSQHWHMLVLRQEQVASRLHRGAMDLLVKLSVYENRSRADSTAAVLLRPRIAEVMRNLLAYCRRRLTTATIVLPQVPPQSPATSAAGTANAASGDAATAMQSATTILLFEPTFQSAITDSSRVTALLYDQSQSRPPVGYLVGLCNRMLQQLQHSLDKHTHLSLQLQQLRRAAEVKTDELVHMIDDATMTSQRHVYMDVWATVSKEPFPHENLDQLSPLIRQRLAYALWSHALEQLHQLAGSLYYNIETSLVIIWHHLGEWLTGDRAGKTTSTLSGVLPKDVRDALRHDATASLVPVFDTHDRLMKHVAIEQVLGHGHHRSSNCAGVSELSHLLVARLRELLRINRAAPSPATGVSGGALVGSGGASTTPMGGRGVGGSSSRTTPSSDYNQHSSARAPTTPSSLTRGSFYVSSPYHS